MKFVVLSDTHGKHRQLDLPKGDVVIHAGDISMKGSESEVLEFLEWFSSLDFENKIFIAGNHDFYFERNDENTIQKIIPKNVIYLQDSFTILENIKIWGSPITPSFFNWAFNRQRGKEIKKHWDMIPEDSDVIVTHGPIFRKLDRTLDGRNVGCYDLYEKIMLLKPKIHICGHIHEAYGITERFGTKYINCSILDANYQIRNNPIEFEI